MNIYMKNSVKTSRLQMPSRSLLHVYWNQVDKTPPKNHQRRKTSGPLLGTTSSDMEEGGGRIQQRGFQRAPNQSYHKHRGKYFYECWNNIQTISIFCHGYKIPFESIPFQKTIPKKYDFSETENKIMSNEVLRLDSLNHKDHRIRKIRSHFKMQTGYV